jgi:bifunctional DNA-binding transcriptional regulator/antitoxin component of YhaV-PrlF toxin-antitoxin module
MFMGANPDELQTIAKVVRDGRITVPIYIREFLDIKDGDKILVTIRKIEI